MEVKREIDSRSRGWGRSDNIKGCSRWTLSAEGQLTTGQGGMGLLRVISYVVPQILDRTK